MTPFDALSPEPPLRARISDRRAETAMNQHQVATTASTTDRSANRCRIITDGTVSKAPEGGACEDLSVSPSHAFVALSFEGAFVWKLPIDCTGPITEGIGISPFENRGKPAIGVDPVHRFAGGKIEDMRPATKSVDTRFRAAVCVLCRDQDYAAWPVPTL